MSTHASLHGDPASGLSITHKGVTYHPRLIVQEIKEKVVNAVEERERKRILAWKDAIPTAELMGLIRDYEENVNSGKFAFDGKECTQFMNSLEGGILLVSLLFGCSPDVAISLMMEQTAELNLVLASIKGRSSPNG